MTNTVMFAVIFYLWILSLPSLEYFPMSFNKNASSSLPLCSPSDSMIDAANTVSYTHCGRSRHTKNVFYCKHEFPNLKNPKYTLVVANYVLITEN